jgi:hypothetical protein
MMDFARPIFAGGAAHLREWCEAQRENALSLEENRFSSCPRPDCVSTLMASQAKRFQMH